MTYRITITATSVTIHKGTFMRRTTVTPALVGAYASLHALHGDKVLPHIWADIAGHPPARHEAQPVRNATPVRSIPFVPTGCPSAVLDNGPTLQPRSVRLSHLQAHGVETAYLSKNYTYR